MKFDEYDRDYIYARPYPHWDLDECSIEKFREFKESLKVFSRFGCYDDSEHCGIHSQTFYSGSLSTFFAQGVGPFAFGIVFFSVFVWRGHDKWKKFHLGPFINPGIIISVTRVLISLAIFLNFPPLIKEL
jgi:hypothetical protein